MAARMAVIATTIISSIKVKPRAELDMAPPSLIPRATGTQGSRQPACHAAAALRACVEYAAARPSGRVAGPVAWPRVAGRAGQGTRGTGKKKAPLARGLVPCWMEPPDQTDGVIEQVAVSASQSVWDTPGSAGVKSMVTEPSTSVEVRAAAGAVQASFRGASTVMPDWTAATAEFMYALASDWQAPSAERMR